MSKRHFTLLSLATLILLSACSRQSNQHAQGYIEGRYTYMATSVSGRLEKLLVDRGTEVKKGQLLFVLEAQPESDMYLAAQQNLKQAQASRDSVIANLAYAKLTFERNKVLVPKKAIQQSELDRARADFESTSAQLVQADANIASLNASLIQADWTLQQKEIAAPVDAVVFDTFYRLGEYAEANQPILSLLAPADIKAIFFVEEAMLGGMALGDPVSVRADGMTQAYEGHISFISPTAEYTPPVIYSTETSPKLIYRIEAEFTADIAKKMHPGQPVEVMFKTHG